MSRKFFNACQCGCTACATTSTTGEDSAVFCFIIFIIIMLGVVIAFNIFGKDPGGEDGDF